MFARLTMSSLFLFGALVLGASACTKATEEKPVAAAPKATTDDRSTQDKEKDTINAAAAMDMPNNFTFTAVQFGYDSCDLDATSRAELDQAAKYLQENKTLHVTIAGHADERGTAEYNLALGEKRAAAVRKYLSTMGVSSERLATISFGELQPVANGQSEDAFAKNRRADFKVDNTNKR
ncbi:MAG: OmpA family protein [Deltaproteobacteria bacterium]|nr:OmpA family protein [Deltaproteobacteria bacterium]